MQAQMVAPRLQWDELTEGLTLTAQELLGKLSVRSVLSHSWEAGGVYPTLLGYALGAGATLALCAAPHWALRFPPAALCALVFWQTLAGMESGAFALLLAFAAIVGVGCTYVQVLSWQEAFAGVARRRQLAGKTKKKKAHNHAKVDKED